MKTEKVKGLKVYTFENRTEVLDFTVRKIRKMTLIELLDLINNKLISLDNNELLAEM